MMKKLIAVAIVFVVAIGGFMVYQSQLGDIELLDPPRKEINFGANLQKLEYLTISTSPIEFDYIGELEKFIEISDNQKELKELMDKSTDIKTVPLLGNYLEYTTVMIYMFYDKDTLLGAEALEFSSNENDEISTKIFTAEGEDFSDDIIYEINYTKEFCPNLDIIGFVTVTTGYPSLRVIGIPEGEKHIEYVWNGMSNKFRLVEPFETIEEGRKAFETYFETMENIRKHIPIYEWEEEYKGSFPPLHHLEHISEETGITNYYTERYYDDVIEVPLLDEDMQQGQYQLYLLYRHGELFAELVFNNIPTNDKTKPDHNIVHQNIGAKNEETGIFKAIESCSYTDAIKDFKEHSNEEIVGVVFDPSSGEFIPQTK